MMGAAKVNTRASIGANIDLVALLCLLLIDVRVFQGTDLVSFTLYELLIWGYCAPIVFSTFVLAGRHLAPQPSSFLASIAQYIGWLAFVSILWFVFRHEPPVFQTVPQNAKNIFPALIETAFLLIRVRDIQTVTMLCNLYIGYSVLSAIVGILQFKYGAPYFRELIDGIEFKMNFEGQVITSPVVGFMYHPNIYAMAILPSVVFVALRLINDIRTGRISLITVASFSLLVVGLLISDARGSIAFSAVAILCIAFARHRKGLFKLTMIVAAVVAVVLYSAQQARLGNAAASTVVGRSVLWQIAYDAMWSEVYVPFFGDGMNYTHRWNWQELGADLPTAHNGWIDQAINFGLPALVLYFRIWWRFFSVTDAAVRREFGLPQNLLDGIRCAVLAFMGVYFFEPVDYVTFPISQLFFLMGLGVATAQLITQTRGQHA
jgi:hypothetical protein